MKTHRFLAFAVSLLLAGPAAAQITPVLSLIPNKPVYGPGEQVTLNVQGAPNTLTLLGVDLDPGPIIVPTGTLHLGLSPAFSSRMAVTDGSGSVDWTASHDCQDPVFGVTFYVQAIQLPVGRRAQLSNGESALWDDLTGACGDLCQGGGVKPAIITLEYTGEDCSATSHSQTPSLVNCSGDPAMAPMVHVIAHDPPNKNIWFEGDVALGDTFDLMAAAAGATRLKGETIVDLYDVNTSALLQSVEFHTSCSEPLFIGDQFGGVEVRAMVLE